MKKPSSIFLKFGAFSALALGIASLIAPQEASAVVTLTFDLRATAVNGVAVSDPKSVAVAANDIVTLQLFAIVVNGNGNQTNDGITSVAGSFISIGNSGGGTGVWSALGTAQTENDQAFRGLGSQSGLLATAADTNFGGADLGLVGGAQDTAIPTPNPYFVANTNSLATLFGTEAANASNLSFLIGTKTFTVTNAGSPIALNFAGRSTSALSKPIKYTTDGVSKSVNGNATADIGYGANVLIAVPEPSAFGMVLMGALGIVGFRRAGGRRF